jgi:hypothetical protein
MIHEWFVVHEGLVGAARLPSLVRSQRRVSATEWLLLVSCGAAAAVTVGFVRLSLGVPGNAIVRAALPMALGISLAPRRLGGSVMSAGACGTAWVLTLTGATSFGSGSMVSLLLIGPMMDVALRSARSGWRVYAALIASGIATNLLALGSRAAVKVLGFDPGARPFDLWWLQALVTYPLSGALAGLLGALCWFRLRDRTGRRPDA